MKRIAYGTGILAALAFVVMLGWPQLSEVIAQAVNSLAVTVSATGVNPQLSATGTDSNIGITFVPKGTGTLQGKITATGTGMHLEMQQASAPTIQNCASATVTTGSTDVSGEVTSKAGCPSGASNIIIVQWGSSWTNQPFCTVSDETTATPLKLTYNSGASVAVTGHANGDVLSYVCIGRF